MLKPTESVIRALASLTNNSNFDTVVDWMRDSLIQQSIANNKAGGEVTIKNQGRNLELEEILTHIKKVPEYKKNMESKA